MKNKLEYKTPWLTLISRAMGMKDTEWTDSQAMVDDEAVKDRLDLSEELTEDAYLITEDNNNLW